MESTTSQTEKLSETQEKNYGNLELSKLKGKPRRTYTNLKDINESNANQNVLIRGRVQTSRRAGNLCFLKIRQIFYSIQAVVAKGSEISKEMVIFVSKVQKESIVEIEGTVSIPKEKITSTTQPVEILVQTFFVVSEPESPLPFYLEDASVPKSLLEEQEQKIEKIETRIFELRKSIEGQEHLPESQSIIQEIESLEQEKHKSYRYVQVGMNTRLDHRVVDLRTAANQAIFRIQSGVCQLFREFLIQNEFTEIHSPKLVGSSSEGGASVFSVKYFEKNAYLAQSPQFYKQMAISSDLERVFEIAPVFRAENANTHRHLTEFVGLDLEMTFNEHYHEVLDVLDGLFNHIFIGIKNRYSKELEMVYQQYPYKPFTYSYPSPRIPYSEGVKMLRQSGENMGELDDLSTMMERKLGQLVKNKYGTDFYILDQFPLQVRPFYTKPSEENPNYANAYDFFIRGEEVMSGSERVNKRSELISRALQSKINLESIKDYLNSFSYATSPHAGGGVGLERVVMLYLGLENIRLSSLFPRDPHRISP